MIYDFYLYTHRHALHQLVLTVLLMKYRGSVELLCSAGGCPRAVMAEHTQAMRAGDCSFTMR